MQSTLFPQDSFDGLESNNQHYNKGLFREQSLLQPLQSIGAVTSKSKMLKVAAYCRVSTVSEMQENSLENQTIYYTNHIRMNPEYHFVGIYSDRGKTGTNISSRSGFQRIIKHAFEGKIDLILCKSISRFARNVTDTLDMIRMLKEHGVRVIFDKENIDTFSIESQFIVVLLAAFAQEESRSISENITWSKAKSFERGEPSFVRILGYKKDKRKNWVIDEEEANVVREAFELCLQKEIPAKIAKRFITKGYQKANGRIDWTGAAISNMLKNERYTGDVLCQKTYVEDHLSHKSIKNNGERNQYLIKNHHEAIIDIETFNKAQEMISNVRKYSKRGKRNSYPLSGRLLCGECGGTLNRFRTRGNIVWRCNKRVKSKELCNTKCVREHDIEKVIYLAFYEKYQLKGNLQGKRKIQKMTKDIENVMSSVEYEINQLKLNLERVLFKENIAIIKFRDTGTFEQNINLETERKEIEEKIEIKNAWWSMLECDNEYRKEALETLKMLNAINKPMKQMKEYLNKIEFLRAWVVKIKVMSPNAFTIIWSTGEETYVELSEGEDISGRK